MLSQHHSPRKIVAHFKVHSNIIGSETNMKREWKNNFNILNDAQSRSKRKTLTTTIISSICLGNSIIISPFSVFRWLSLLMKRQTTNSCKMVKCNQISKWNKTMCNSWARSRIAYRVPHRTAPHSWKMLHCLPFATAIYVKLMTYNSRKHFFFLLLL